MLTDCRVKCNEIVVGTVVCTHLYGICGGTKKCMEAYGNIGERMEW